MFNWHSIGLVKRTTLSLFFYEGKYLLKNDDNDANKHHQPIITINNSNMKVCTDGNILDDV